MKNIQVKDIVRECNGSLVFGDENIECINFSTDTRKIENGDVYVGLKGEKFDVYAVDQNFHAKARFKQTIVDEEHIRLSMNMTNPGNCECLPMGSYFFYVCRKQEILAKCVMAHELVPEAENVS